MCRNQQRHSFVTTFTLFKNSLRSAALILALSTLSTYKTLFTKTKTIMSIKSTLFMGLAALGAFTDAAPTKRASAGKRGIAFPKQNNGVAGSQYTKLFKGHDQITWMYDWEAVIDGTPVDGLEYVPLLHSNQDWCTSGWATNVANAQKNYKVSHVLSFNEPDQCGYVSPLHHTSFIIEANTL